MSTEPDQAKIEVGVVTKASTASEAAAQNATRVDAVLSQLRQVLGQSAEIKTTNYSLNPEYRRPSNGEQVLTGFIASNRVQVTIENLSAIGDVIDAVTHAGANTVHGLRFTLKEPEPLRAKVLGMAAQQARSHAAAIAEGLGEEIGEVLVAQEGVAFGPPRTEDMLVGRATSTPIETGLVEISATVTVEAELR